MLNNRETGVEAALLTSAETCCSKVVRGLWELKAQVLEDSFKHLAKMPPVLVAVTGKIYLNKAAQIDANIKGICPIFDPLAACPVLSGKHCQVLKDRWGIKSI